MPLIGEILMDALNIDVDAESRLRTFIALTTAIENKQIIFKNAGKDLELFLETLVTGIFFLFEYIIDLQALTLKTSFPKNINEFYYISIRILCLLKI